jgi:hypothetical protein
VNFRPRFLGWLVVKAKGKDFLSKGQTTRNTMKASKQQTAPPANRANVVVVVAVGCRLQVLFGQQQQLTNETTTNLI